MRNDRLGDALMSAGMTPDDAAHQLGVDPKTVERWIRTGRAPYPKYRHKLAALLREGEMYLWPDSLIAEKAVAVSESEIIKTYSHRNSVPADLWDRLLDRAQDGIDILVYVGMFMTEKADLLTTLQKKAENGTQIRLLLGDRNSAAVIQRSIDEGIGAQTICQDRPRVGVLRRAGRYARYRRPNARHGALQQHLSLR